MLWHDLKQSIHAQKPSNVAELKQFCKEEWAKFLHSDVKDSLPVIANAWLQLLPQRVAQPVIRFRGQLLFHVVPGRFGQLFPLNKWNHHFKTAFCIYSGYLCVILKSVWWSESFKCDKYAKNKKIKTERGQKPFSRHCRILEPITWSLNIMWLIMCCLPIHLLLVFGF